MNPDGIFSTKKDFVANLIRTKLLSGEFEPGQRLLQDELAAELGFSSTPVREALRQLVAEGLLMDAPHRGVRVPKIKPRQAKGVYRIRIALEGLATELACANIQTQQLDRLNDIETKLEGAMKQGDQDQTRRLNREFHYNIYEYCDLPLLLNMIDLIWPHFPWNAIMSMIAHRLDEIASEHQKIEAALREGDPIKARQAMESHIKNGALSLLNHFAEQREVTGEQL